MALTSITSVTVDHIVTFTDDLVFTFKLAPISGTVYQQILDDHRDEDGKTSNDSVAAALMFAGITSARSNGDEFQDFGRDDAAEIWDEWPDWARWDVYNAVQHFATRGPGADPLDVPTKKGRAVR